MREAKVYTLLFLQIHFALYLCWASSSGWSYAPPYLVPYVPEQSCNQYAQPVYFGPPQDCYITQCYPYTMYQGPLETQCNTGYGNCLQEVQYGPYGTQYYQQPSYFNPIPEVARTPFLQPNGEPVILLPENNRGVKYVPPIACDNTSPYPYLPPIIIINDDDDDDNDLFDFDDGGGFGLNKLLALFLALQGRSDGNPFTPSPPPPPPPPSTPPGNWGNPPGQNCQCCCCKCKCGSDSSNGNSNSDNQDSGSSSNYRGTTTHITIVLPKSWGVSQTSNKC